MRLKAVSILLVAALGLYSAPMLVYWGFKYSLGKVGISLEAAAAHWSRQGITITDIAAPGIRLRELSIKPSWSNRFFIAITVHGGQLQLDQLALHAPENGGDRMVGVQLSCTDIEVIDNDSEASWRIAGQLALVGSSVDLAFVGAGPSGELCAQLMRDEHRWNGEVEVEQLSARALVGLLGRVTGDMDTGSICIDAGLLSGHLTLIDGQYSGDLLLAGIRGSCAGIGLSAGIEEGLLSLAGAQGALLTISEGAWLDWGAAGLCDLKGTVLWDAKPLLDLSGTLKSDRRKSVHLTSRGSTDGLKTRCELLRVPLKPALAEVSFTNADEGFITDVMLRDFGRYENQLLKEWTQEWLGAAMPCGGWDAATLQATASLHWKQGVLQFLELEELHAEDVSIVCNGAEGAWGQLEIDTLDARLRGSLEHGDWSGVIDASDGTWSASAEGAPVLQQLQMQIVLAEHATPQITAMGSYAAGHFDLLLSPAGDVTAAWRANSGLAEAEFALADGTCRGSCKIAHEYLSLPLTFSSKFDERSWVEFLQKPTDRWLKDRSVSIDSFALNAAVGEHSCSVAGNGQMIFGEDGVRSELLLEHGEGSFLGSAWALKGALLQAQHSYDLDALYVQSALPLSLEGGNTQIIRGQLSWNEGRLEAHGGPEQQAERWSLAWLPKLGQGYVDFCRSASTEPQLQLTAAHEAQQWSMQAEGLERSIFKGFSIALQLDEKSWSRGSLLLNSQAWLMQSLLKMMGHAETADHVGALGDRMQLQARWDHSQPLELEFCVLDGSAGLCSICGGYDSGCFKLEKGHMGPFLFRADMLADASSVTLTDASALLDDQQALSLHAFTENGLTISLEEQAWAPLMQQAYRLWPELQQVAPWIEPIGHLHLMIDTDGQEGWIVEASRCNLRLGGLPMALRNLGVQPVMESWIAEGSFCNGGHYDPFKLTLDSGEGAGSGHLEMRHEHLRFGWESGAEGLTPLCVCGDFCGQHLKLLLDGTDQNSLCGTIIFDFDQMERLLEPAMVEAITALGLSGKVIFDGLVTIDGDVVKLRGSLRGEEVSLLHVVWGHFSAHIDTDSDRVIFSNMQATAEGGTLTVDNITVAKDGSTEWQVAIPRLRASGLVANKLRWPGQQQRGLQHLKIEAFGIDGLSGKLSDPKTWLGRGFARFDNESPRPIFILIPAEILSNLGLDPALLEPVKGTVHFAFEDGWIRLKELENVCSRKQRSQFMLHEDPGFALISWDGQLYLRLRMKQNVLFSLTESLNLYITGTLWHPEISFQHSEQRYAPLLSESIE